MKSPIAVDTVNRKLIYKAYDIDGVPRTNSVWNFENDILSNHGIVKPKFIHQDKPKYPQYYIQPKTVDYDTGTITFTYTPKDVEQYKKSMVEEVNKEAGRRITAISSDIDQRNKLALYNELLEKKIDGTLKDRDTELMTRLKHTWDQIKDIRLESNLVCIEIQDTLDTIDDIILFENEPYNKKVEYRDISEFNSAEELEEYAKIELNRDLDGRLTLENMYAELVSIDTYVPSTLNKTKDW